MNPFALVAAISFPILERIPIFGDFAVSPHGLGIAIGFGLGAILMGRRAQKRGLGHVHVPDISVAIQDLLTRAAIGAIIGARGFYVLTHLDQFEGDWIRVLYAWEGGLTFLGGVTGAVLLAIPFARNRGWKMSMLLDSAAPGIALGLAIGRIGDLMIGDHIGSPTDFPLGWRCTANYWVRETNSFGRIEPLVYPAGGVEPTAGCFDVAVHHTALYDFGATVIVLLVLLLMERRRWFDGAFIAAWVWVYGALRITSDFARNDRTWSGLTGSQWSLVAAMLLVAGALLVTKPWRRERWAWDRVFEHPWKQPDFDAEAFQIGEGPLLVGSGDRTRGAHAVLSAAQGEAQAAPAANLLPQSPASVEQRPWDVASSAEAASSPGQTSPDDSADDLADPDVAELSPASREESEEGSAPAASHGQPLPTPAHRPTGAANPFEPPIERPTPADPDAGPRMARRRDHRGSGV